MYQVKVTLPCEGTTMTKKIEMPSGKKLAVFRTYAKILQKLEVKKGRIRWKDLLEETRLSSRTLSRRLKELEERGVVRRIVDTSVYPPAVYYEGTKLSYLLSLPLLAGLNAVTQMLDERLHTRRIIETGASNPEKLLENLFTQYINDLLSTLNFSIEDFEQNKEKSQWAYLVSFHIEAYESRIMELMRVAIYDPKLRETIKNMYANSKKEDDDEKTEKNIQEIIKPFNNKELAKIMVGQYCALLVQGIVKTPSDFIKILKTDENLRQKIKRLYGTEINDETLISFMSDSGWSSKIFEK